MSALGFDVYGTLVDPLAMREPLRALAGDKAERLSEVWRCNQLQYTWRRGLMRRYENFDVCTRQALQAAMATVGVALSAADQDQLMAAYLNLDLFPDVIPALAALKAQGHALVAFSNGVEATVRTLLSRTGAMNYLAGIVSVDDLKTFKPDPAVYAYLAERCQTDKADTWLVSGNAWDIIGAASAGLKTAWLKRSPAAVFDPWDIEPDLVVGNLEELAGRLAE